MDAMEEAVIALVGERQKALRLAEKIQAQLESYGVQLVDSPAGTTWVLKSFAQSEKSSAGHPG